MPFQEKLRWIVNYGDRIRVKYIWQTFSGLQSIYIYIYMEELINKPWITESNINWNPTRNNSWWTFKVLISKFPVFQWNLQNQHLIMKVTVSDPGNWIRKDSNKHKKCSLFRVFQLPVTPPWCEPRRALSVMVVSVCMKFAPRLYYWLEIELAAWIETIGSRNVVRQWALETVNPG